MKFLISVDSNKKISLNSVVVTQVFCYLRIFVTFVMKEGGGGGGIELRRTRLGCKVAQSETVVVSTIAHLRPFEDVHYT